MNKEEIKIVDEQIKKDVQQLAEIITPRTKIPYSSVAALSGLEQYAGQITLKYNIESIQTAIRAAIENIGGIPMSSLNLIADSVMVNNTAVSQMVEQSRLFYKMLAPSIPKIERSLNYFASQISIPNITGTLFNIYEEEEPVTEEEKTSIEEVNSIILDEIYNNKSEVPNSDTIIVLSPINDAVLKYLADHPKELYNLKPGMFEDVMTEIYRRLGYNVQKTKKTRDGGKDILIRKSDILGDFIYYVECKRFSPNRAIGVGIVRDFCGAVNIDRVNGGIIATTSYFSKDARRLIVNEKLGYQIQMHDFKKIQSMLKVVTK